MRPSGPTARGRWMGQIVSRKHSFLVPPVAALVLVCLLDALLHSPSNKPLRLARTIPEPTTLVETQESIVPEYTLGESVELGQDTFHVQMATGATPPFLITLYKQKPDIVSNNIRKGGVWDAGVSYVMLKILAAKEGRHTIMDFGTHVGWFSLLAASKGHSSIGIEAMESNRQALLYSVKLNGFQNNIRLHAGALGDDHSPPSLCIGARTTGNVGNGQVSTTNEKNSGECTETIAVTTLDDIAGRERIMFVKADCEGCEASAIMGGRKWIRENPPCSIFVEWRPDSMREVSTTRPKDVAQFLKDSGFMFYRLQCHPITGANLTMTELQVPNVAVYLGQNNGDMLFLHDSEKCFARGSAAYNSLLAEVASLPMLGKQNAIPL